jgi:hypothetical protein
MLFVLAALSDVTSRRSRFGAIALIAAGLAVAFVVPLWDASQNM